MSESALRIGFIGLGVMGRPMAGHLVRAGHFVSVFDATPSALESFAREHAGARPVESPAALGSESDIVITMVPDGNAVHDVVFGSRGSAGLLDTLAAGSLVLDTSSSQPVLTRETAAALLSKGIDMVDAPVSGAQWGAEAAELVFMVGGSQHAVARVTPILSVLGRAIHHVGPIGSGHTMKCINNTITALTFLATCEGLSLGALSGLDPAAMNAVLNESTGGSWITKNHIEQRILSRTFDDPFRLDLMRKDVGIGLDVATSLGVDAPTFALADRLYQAAAEAAGPGASLSEIARFVERYVGGEIGPQAN
jgi:3-hydroxyisobutyrate dehydrogenase